MGQISKYSKDFQHIFIPASGFAGAGLLAAEDGRFPGPSCPSANILSSLDSNPPTACDKKDPHLEEPCFAGLVMIF